MTQKMDVFLEKNRIRNYNDKLEFSLEKKISSVEGKFKKVLKYQKD